MPDTTRILIVDDSRVFRGVLEQALLDVPGVAVVGSEWNGVRALEFLKRTPVDLVTLDLEMPQMGGLETLRTIQKWNAARPEATPVGALLVSAYTSEGAAVTIEGLEAGAFDFITKPAGGNVDDNLAYLRHQLKSKIQAFQARRGVRPLPAPTEAAGQHPAGGGVRRDRRSRVRAIAIGVSTGGPQALSKVLPDLTRRVSLPVFIVQHLPAGFTSSLAASLARQCDQRVVEAADGKLVEQRTVYIAPGGRHLLLRREPNQAVITVVNDQPPQNGCRPSADVLFRSVAAVYGATALGVIMTGMGCDGTSGLAAMKRAGAPVLAQDEPSSTVWGMPGSAVAAGVVDQVLPLGRLAEAIQALVNAPGASGASGSSGGA